MTTKSITTISIDTSIISRIREKNINISRLINEMLKNYLNDDLPKETKEVLERQQENINKEIERLTIDRIKLNDQLRELENQEKQKEQERLKVIEEKTAEEKRQGWFCISCDTRNHLQRERCVNCGFKKVTKEQFINLKGLDHYERLQRSVRLLDDV